MSESTKAGHTVGRLSLDRLQRTNLSGFGVIECIPFGRLMGTDNGESIGVVWVPERDATERATLDAERLAACWNACEGIPAEGLQALVVPKILLDQADTERDALRTQISNMARQCNDWTRRFAESVQAQDALRSEVERLKAALSDFIDAIERIRSNARAARGRQVSAPSVFTPSVERGGWVRYKLYRFGPNLFGIGPHVKPFKATAEPDACGLGCFCGAFLTNVSKRGQEQLKRAVQIDSMSKPIEPQP